ncbi:MAG: hypothetical protein ACUZ8I_07700 [Candidatus Scalindua sp.]
MPVKAVGKKIVEISTGKVVGTATSERNAHISASIRNKAIKAKGGIRKK